MEIPEQIRLFFLPKGVRGVAQSNGKIAYLTNPTDGIDAIDLNDGKKLWTSNEASQPLMAASNWLAAIKIIPDRSNAFKIVKLNTERNGDLLWLSELIVFPTWVLFQYLPTVFHSWLSVPWLRGNINFQVHTSGDNLFLDWQAQDYYRGGANPPGFILQEYEQRKDSGTVRIDLNSGKIKMLPSIEQVTTPAKDKYLQEKLQSGWWIVGQKLALLVDERFDGQRKLQLRICGRSVNDRVEQVIELTRSSKDQLMVFEVTPDGYYILVCPNVHSDQEQPWWIFSAETGQLLTTLNYDFGTKTASIFNSKIYYLVDREINSTTEGLIFQQTVLRVKDLSSGKLLWEYLVQEQPNLHPPVYP